MNQSGMKPESSANLSGPEGTIAGNSNPGVPSPYTPSAQAGQYFPQNNNSYGYDQTPSLKTSFSPVEQPSIAEYGGGYDPRSNVQGHGSSRVQMAQPGQFSPGQVVNVQGIIQADTMILAEEERVNMNPYLILSCLVAWFCCFILGLIAYIVARNGWYAGTAEEAKTRGKISLGLSIAGIIVGIIVITTVIVIRSQDSYTYTSY